MLETILALDEQIFFLFNDTLSSAFGDFIMPWITNKKTWIPLYLGIIVWLFFKNKNKVLPFLLICLIGVGISDGLSSKVIKPHFQRVRPCNDVEIKEKVTTFKNCGGGYSFTSSHATNHFMLGMYWFGTIGLLFKKWRWLCFFWAGIIAFSRVYVGVHYPIDIIFGSGLGMLIGLFLIYIYRKMPPKWQFSEADNI